MKLESFIAGAIIGSAFSRPDIQKAVGNMTRKGAKFVVDSLNKRGSGDEPTVQGAATTEKQD